VGPRPDVAALDAGSEVLKKSREKIDLSREQDRDAPKPDIKQIAHCSRNLKPATELFKSGHYGSKQASTHYPRFGEQYRLPFPYEPDQDDGKGM